MTHSFVIGLGVFVLTILPVGHAHGGEPAKWSPAAAAKYLDGRAEFWLNWSSAARGQGTACISCHTSLPFAIARPALGKSLGETGASPNEKKLLDGLKKRVDNWEKIVAEPTAVKDPFVPFYSKKMKPSALGTESVLNALVLANHDARRSKGVLSESTKKALDHLWGQQQENGAWLWLEFGLSPWEADAAYYGASLAALAVGTAGKDYYEQADVQPKVTALKKYLVTQFSSQRLHHRAVALWASSRLPGIVADKDKQQAIDDLLNAQEADGGWSLPKLGKKTSGKAAWTSHGAFPPGVASDGYATGLAVLSLKSAVLPSPLRGRGVGGEGVQKGVRWLAAQQQKDGTWGINYVNKPRDPETNVGKFMRDSATAFAILALTEPN